MTPNNELTHIQEKVFSPNVSLEEQRNIIYSLLEKTDIVSIKGKKYINKRGYRKIALCLNISTQVVKETRIIDGENFIYDFTVRAVTALGRYTEASASCASNEREFNHLQNDVRATSQTRATNRAISDLIWLWEVSFEEIEKPQWEHQSSTEGFQWDLQEEDFIPPTAKQRGFLIKLVEERYEDEATRASLYMRIDQLSKQEATKAISDMLNNGEF